MSNGGLSFQFVVTSRFLWRHNLTYEFLYVIFHMWPHTIQNFSPANPVMCKSAYSAVCGFEPILEHGPQTPPQHCLFSPTSFGGADFYQTRSFHFVRCVSCPPCLIHCGELKEQLLLQYGIWYHTRWWPAGAAVTTVLYWNTVVTCRSSCHYSTVSDTIHGDDLQEQLLLQYCTW